jgi:hypothetical protein
MKLLLCQVSLLDVPMIMMIQPISSGVMVGLFAFSVLAPWWQSQESDQIWSVRSSDLGVRMYKVSRQ